MLVALYMQVSCAYIYDIGIPIEIYPKIVNGTNSYLKFNFVLTLSISVKKIGVLIRRRAQKKEVKVLINFFDHKIKLIKFFVKDTFTGLSTLYTN